MSEQSQALLLHFNKLTELKEYFNHHFEQLLIAKGARFDDYELVEVTERGVLLKTTYRSCGDTDEDSHFFLMSDLDVDVDELNRRQNERLEKERVEREARAAADRKRQEAIIEARDFKEYERLKAKYES